MTKYIRVTAQGNSGITAKRLLTPCNKVVEEMESMEYDIDPSFSDCKKKSFALDTNSIHEKARQLAVRHLYTDEDVPDDPASGLFTSYHTNQQNLMPARVG